jgi:hypothetical protein
MGYETRSWPSWLSSSDRSSPGLSDEAGERQWPTRWFDADNFLKGLLIEAPVVDGLELVVFRDEGHVVEVTTSKDVLTVAGRMPSVLVAMDAAQETT